MASKKKQKYINKKTLLILAALFAAGGFSALVFFNCVELALSLGEMSFLSGIGSALCADLEGE